jgi:hypothetical protein
MTPRWTALTRREKGYRPVKDRPKSSGQQDWEDAVEAELTALRREIERLNHELVKQGGRRADEGARGAPAPCQGGAAMSVALPDVAVAASNSLADLAARIRAEHESASAALKDSVRHAISAGKLLIEAKTQLGHGQ